MSQCSHCSGSNALLENGICPACGRIAAENSELNDNDEVGGFQDPMAEDTRSLESSTVPPPQPIAPKLSFLGAIGWCLALLLVQVLLGLVVGVVLIVTGFSTLFVENQRSFIVCFVVAQLLMLAIGWNQLKPDPVRALAIRGISLFHLFLVVLLILPLAVLSEEIANRAGDTYDHFIGTEEALEASVISIDQARGQIGYASPFGEQLEVLAQQPWIIMILVGCGVPGVCEEVFFRGFLGRGLLARYGVVVGVLLTSLIFALFHIDPVQVCYTFVIGIVFHLVYSWTRTLWGPVLVHISFNVMGLAQGKLILDGRLVFGGGAGDENIWIPWWLTAATLGAVIALAFLFYHSRIRFQAADDDQSS